MIPPGVGDIADILQEEFRDKCRLDRDTAIVIAYRIYNYNYNLNKKG